MTVVVDTSILIDHLRGDSRARFVLAQAIESGQRLVGSALTRAEVLAGMRAKEEDATHRLLALMTWIDVDVAIAERAGEMGRQYLRSHPGIDLVDFVIAATAERLEAEVWTRNTKHFPMLQRVRDPHGSGADSRAVT